MDIDFITDTATGVFQITLGDNPLGVTGNRALMNRFQITFLTKRRQFIEGTLTVNDQYGGDAFKFVAQPAVLNDPQSIAASITTAMDMTVKSMQADTGFNTPDTEKIVSASLASLDIISGVVTASIQIIPVETEVYSNLIFNVPIISIN